MNLYSEEQVLNALRLAHSHIKPLQYVVDTLTPIELPSDEVIGKAIFPYMDSLAKAGFIDGAKWMRDKIEGGNK